MVDYCLPDDKETGWIFEALGRTSHQSVVEGIAAEETSGITRERAREQRRNEPAKERSLGKYSHLQIN